MARLNTTTTYSAVPSSGSHGAALRAALVAGFSYWTVGAVTSFSAGSTLREYFVLSHTAGHEILVLCSGLTSSGTNLIYAGYFGGGDGGTATTGAMFFSYAPDGGYQASLSAGNDPATQGFWDYINITLGLRKSSDTYTIPRWFSGQANQLSLLFTEDSISEYLSMVSIDDVSILNQFGFVIFANNFYNPVLETTGVKNIYPEGLSWGRTASTAKPKDIVSIRFAWWNQEGDREVSSTNYSANLASLDNVSSGAFPLGDSKILTSYVNIVTSTKIPARINKDYLRATPYNNGHNDKLGTDNNFKFIGGLARGWALPWDNNEVNPT